MNFNRLDLEMNYSVVFYFIEHNITYLDGKIQEKFINTVLQQKYMTGVEQLYDSNEPANDCEITTTRETIATVDPLSRIQFEGDYDDMDDDVISVRIEPH